MVGHNMQTFQGMEVRTFKGILDHKNPSCDMCSGHCYALYQGGKKDKLADMYVCKKCNIIYQLPTIKKCKFMEVVEA